MIENDTIKLLRECDSGIKMGVSAINDTIGAVSSSRFRRQLSECRREHRALESEVEAQLKRCGDHGRSPGAVAQSMSRIKTALRLSFDRSDAAAADLLTDGCGMGVKSLNRYLNRYKAADEVSKDIAKRLIKLEEKLSTDIRGYL